MPFLDAEFGNPSSTTHAYGRRAREAVESARAEVARLLGAPPETIVFTAGATEANNLALKGAARAARAAGRPASHLVGTTLEHKSVSVTLKALEAEGFPVSLAAPAPDGVIDPAAVAVALRPETLLVSMIAANAEIGTVQPVAAVGALCRERGVLFHTDATQMVGKLPVDVESMRIDLLALSAHKFYGPKGVGALYRRPGVDLEPLFSGGGQEGGLRSGTLNVPGIVGLGAVARIRREEMAAEAERLTALRERLWAGIRSAVPGARLNGHPAERLPGNLNVSFPGMPSERLFAALEGFALSAGSACLSDVREPSEALAALGLDYALASCTLRFGLGASTTAEEVDRLVGAIGEAARSLRDAREEV